MHTSDVSPHDFVDFSLPSSDPVQSEKSDLQADKEPTPEELRKFYQQQLALFMQN